MAKKKQGHFCRICHRHRANEKFSGKGHRQHICKECHREQQQQKRERKRANKQARAVGLRPIKKDYPKDVRQAASYLQISVEAFEVACHELALEPCTVKIDWGTPTPLYDINAMIAVHHFQQTESAHTHPQDNESGEDDAKAQPTTD